MSKQYWHQRRGGGKKSKFGSYKYTAAELYEKGILLSVNQFSPRQFDKIHVVIKSDDVGVFVLEMSHPTGNGVLGREELRMEDLLQAQFDNNVRLDLFDGMAAFNLNMLIHQINKSESKQNKLMWLTRCRVLRIVETQRRESRFRFAFPFQTYKESRSCSRNVMYPRTAAGLICTVDYRHAGLVCTENNECSCM